MSKQVDHPQRYATVNELHARPFPSLTVPCEAVYLAFKEPEQAANRDRGRDIAHLSDLLGRLGSEAPAGIVNHYSGNAQGVDLKWESHTEFVTYSAFSDGLSMPAFNGKSAQVFSPDWIAGAPGKRLAALTIRVEELPEDLEIVVPLLRDWFVQESLACAQIIEGAAIVAGDFQIDASGQMRFAVFVRKGTGKRRVGRIVQRLCEIEVYRAMSMLGLLRARGLGQTLNALDNQLSDLVSGLNGAHASSEVALNSLLAIAAELESLSLQYSYRFAATAAYEAIVNQRIEILRETRIYGRQTFGEFMMRRYDPAMRTVKATDERLKSLANRAQRAAELLRTRVDVDRSAQNQKLLESMNDRADLQLRLQRTVEGLSVVAISYYGVNLASYAAYPLTEVLGISKSIATSVLTPLVVGLVWLMVRRIQRKMH
ncbi:MAG TPA: DUF3422 domain-containing protein [Rhodobacter sp.]|nr:DUF3422 domain-containing protein [Rhodobacter sp.]HCM98524.1 DUF3422 domain-containing protein [Rhodobacter sp.]